MSHRFARPMTALTALLSAAITLGCQETVPTEVVSGDDAPLFAPNCDKSSSPQCDGDGGGDDGDDGGDGVLFDLPDETLDNGLTIADANHGDLFNDGGRWLDVGFVGNDGLPAVSLNYDATKRAFDNEECSARNTTGDVTATDLAGFLVHGVDAGNMVSGGLTVDKKGDEGGTSTEHRVGVQVDDSGQRMLVALKGNLGSPITVQGDASADPAAVTLTGGTVRVRAKVSGSARTDPVLDCPHRDFVEATVDRQ